MSTVCPRAKSQAVKDCIEQVNAGLVAVCDNYDKVTLNDSTQLFFTADGEVNDGYIMRDGVHITNTAMNRLAKKWGLRMKDESKGVCTLYRPNDRSPRNNSSGYQQQNQRQNNQRQYNNNHHQQQHYQGNQRYQGYHQSQRNGNEPTCYNCGEENHVRSNCKFNHPIRCYACGGRGHKARDCQPSR